MKFQVYFLLVAAATPAHAGGVSHGAPGAVLPALADLPGKGHGVLVAPQWVVTCAHNVAAVSPSHVTIGGVRRKVDLVVVHPGYRPLPKAMVDAAMLTGDAAAVMAFLAASDDVALVRLREPVAQVQPVALYGGSGELDETILLLGKGPGAAAAPGEPAASGWRTVLRPARNMVSRVDERWMVYRFDSPASALPLEGMMGAGGAAPAGQASGWTLAGIAAWREVRGDMRKPGRYGDNGVSVRVSRYAQWLRDVIAVR